MKLGQREWVRSQKEQMKRKKGRLEWKSEILSFQRFTKFSVITVEKVNLDKDKKRFKDLYSQGKKIKKIFWFKKKKTGRFN